MPSEYAVLDLKVKKPHPVAAFAERRALEMAWDQIVLGLTVRELAEKYYIGTETVRGGLIRLGIYVPKPRANRTLTPAKRRSRDEMVLKLVQKGKSQHEISVLLNCHWTSISSIEKRLIQEGRMRPRLPSYVTPLATQYAILIAWEEGWWFSEIARRTGKSPSTVKKIIVEGIKKGKVERTHIPTRLEQQRRSIKHYGGNPMSWEDINGMVEMYWMLGKTLQEVAQAYGLSQQSVHHKFRRLGVPRRDRSAAVALSYKRDRRQPENGYTKGTQQRRKAV